MTQQRIDELAKLALVVIISLFAFGLGTCVGQKVHAEEPDDKYVLSYLTATDPSKQLLEFQNTETGYTMRILVTKKQLEDPKMYDALWDHVEAVNESR